MRGKRAKKLRWQRWITYKGEDRGDITDVRPGRRYGGPAINGREYPQSWRIIEGTPVLQGLPRVPVEE